MALLFVTGACSSSSPKATPTASTPAGKGNPAAYAQCMRANGIPNFPDPGGAGQGVHLPAGMDPNSPELRKADTACRKYMPEAPVKDGKGDPWTAADKLKYAQCMRAGGVPRFPDPKADGSMVIDEASGVDPESAQFKRAAEACKKYQSKEAQNAPKIDNRGHK